MTDESQDIVFPLNGIDVSTAASETPAFTTPVGVNVRNRDPFQNRERGGSRTGLSPWIDSRTAEGATKTQHLNTVFHYTPATSLDPVEQAGETNAPGGLIVDTVTTNCYPDGPMITVCPGDPIPGPGGGPLAPTSPPFPPGFNARIPTSPPAPFPRVRPKKGSGIQPHRAIGPATDPFPPPPPPPPGPFTRTFIPFSEFLGGEFLPVFSIGPFTEPLTPPTDLMPIVTTPGADTCGDLMLIDLATWGGTLLPTLAEINALVLSHGCSYGPPGEGGPYESFIDT